MLLGSISDSFFINGKVHVQMARSKNQEIKCIHFFLADSYIPHIIHVYFHTIKGIWSSVAMAEVPALFQNPIHHSAMCHKANIYFGPINDP